MENIITFPSMTAALKAREVLRRHSIPAGLIRTPARLRKGSCGYSLSVGKQLDRTEEVLKRNHISYKGVFADDNQ